VIHNKAGSNISIRNAHRSQTHQTDLTEPQLYQNAVHEYWDDKNTAQRADKNLWTNLNLNKWVDNYSKTANIKSELIFGYHNPKAVVSIVIPAYRRADVLRRALDSALDQDFAGEYEIIVVDDSATGNSDSSPLRSLMSTYCSKFKNIIYYHNMKNLGSSDNWNRCFMLARTQWFCLLHHDDALFSNYLSEMMSFHKFFESEGVAMATPAINMVMDVRKGHSIDMYIKIFNFFLTFRKNSCVILDRKSPLSAAGSNTCMFINREKAISSGGLDDNYGSIADYVWHLYCKLHFKILLFPKILATGYKTRASGSQTANPKQPEIWEFIYYKTNLALAESLGFSPSKARRFAGGIFSHTSSSYSELSSTERARIAKDLGISKIYLMKFVSLWFSISSKLNRSYFLMFHRTKMINDI
jgi:glycosyltransferase involved in cell wall biosynthesis